MRFHRNLVYAVVDGMDQIFNQDEYADKVVERLLKRDKRWGSRDRGFIAETLYDIVRWKRLYSEIAEVKPPYSRTDCFRLFAVWSVLRGHPLPDWKEFVQVPERRIKGRFDELSKIRKFRESVPDWIDKLMSEQLGEAKWEKEIHALNEPAPVILRANALLNSREELAESLAAEGIKCRFIAACPDALELEERANVFTTEAFKKGSFEVQDAASQLVGPFLEAAPGMRIIDACAGAGGKTLHLAALMQNKGQLLALDIYPNKLKELKRRASRAKAFNIETRPITSAKTIKRLERSADRVLIDAPCTGLGVLRRNPDAKWKLKEGFVNEVCGLQQSLLSDYSKMVKPGGKLVYATCSILPLENQLQVSEFLKSEAGLEFTLEEERTISVSETGFDGFYMARLSRKAL
ncbi:RsmB/NOP family class I SAM-dependent RNA methyltransferase [Robiginitalea sp. IMCC44478]|uniref:RsmB/NOP family class I SAM-dependent RNA methyltransferase n=1 Tax=Robiginitalea sp. IMCC44478 TaxID=3459122 RepID=UPI0040414550